MDDLENVDYGTVEEACYRGVIEAIVTSLNKSYHSYGSPTPLRIKHAEIKIQWPIDGRHLDYTRCAINYGAVTIQAFCVNDSLIVEAFEPTARMEGSTISSGGQPYFVNKFNETSYQLADPDVHNKAIQLISSKLEKYLGE